MPPAGFRRRPGRDRAGHHRGDRRARLPALLRPAPQLPIRLAGSHATDCRCVPICGTCGDHESLTGLIDPIYWPLDRDIVTAYVADIRAHTTPAILGLTTGTLISETDGVIGHVRLPHEPDE